MCVCMNGDASDRCIDEKEETEDKRRGGEDKDNDASNAVMATADSNLISVAECALFPRIHIRSKLLMRLACITEGYKFRVTAETRGN